MPLRSRIDRARIDSDPRWNDVNEADREAIFAMLDRGRNVAAILRFREVTGRGLAESKEAVEGILHCTEFAPPEDGPPCPHCGKSLRVKASRQCFRCGADWHDRSPCGSEKTAE
jgi:hypothetical protein